MSNVVTIQAVILNGQSVRVLTPGPRCVATDLALALRGTPEVDGLLMDVPEALIELQSVEVFPLGPMLVRTLGLAALEWLVSSAGPHHQLGWLPGWLEASVGAAADKVLANHSTTERPHAPASLPAVSATASAPGTGLMLNIGELNVRQDEEGRFSLNDLHRAAGGEDRHSPNRFTRTDTFAALVQELTPEMASAPVVTHRTGIPGTYVCRELVYAYAMWISAKFHIQVIRAYDALVTGRLAVPALPPTQGGCDLFRGLMLAVNGRYVAAVLLLYLLANDAHRSLMFKRISKMHRDINDLADCSSLQRAANALVDDGLLYLIDGGYGVNEPNLLQRMSGAYGRVLEAGEARKVLESRFCNSVDFSTASWEIRRARRHSRNTA